MFLAPLILAGCVGDAPSAIAPALDDVPELLGPLIEILTDPAGDAYARNSGYFRGALPCAWVLDRSSRKCLADDIPSTGTEPIGAVPADPAADILALRFQESESTLHAYLEIAGLSQDLQGAVGPGTGLFYSIDFRDEADCGRTLFIQWAPIADGISEASASHTRPCAARPDVCPMTCFRDLPAIVEFGSPATIHLAMDRIAHDSPPLGATLRNISVTTIVFPQGNDANAAWLGTSGPVNAYAYPESGYAVDVTRNDRSFTFTQATAPRVVPSGLLRIESSHPVRHTPTTRPDEYLTALTWEDSPESFRAAVEIERVDETPGNHSIFVAFAFRDFTVQLAAQARDGNRRGAGVLAVGDDQPIQIPVSLSIETGSPGRVRFEVARTDLPLVEAGDAFNYLFSGISIVAEEAVGADSIATIRAGAWEIDYLPAAGQHTVATSASSERSPSQRIGDGTGDVDAPLDLTASRQGYDLEGVDIISVKPGELRFSLAVTDLGDLRPPDGYDAIFYGIGIKHERGSTMIGHYRSTDRLAGEFMCAPDSTILETTPSDPTQSSWERIPGIIQAANNERGLNGQESSGSAAIVMYARASCFGLEDDAYALNATIVKAGSYLVRRSAVSARSSEVFTLDTLQSEDNSTFVFARTVVPTASWWEAPFGVDRFWDIFGGVVAVLTVLITLLLFLKRRLIFQRYLDEIRAIHVKHASDPLTRAAALVELRRRLHEDLENHRVSDSHYPIVLDRIRARLTSARLTSLGAAFYDLSPPVALRIERLLDDGHLSGDEARILEPLVRAGRMSDETKALLLQRMGGWVREDADALSR